MRQNGPITDGFKNRKYERKKTYSGPKFQWRRCAVGRGAIIVIGLIGDSVVERSGAMTRDFAKQGASQRALFSEFIRLCPGFASHYLSARGAPLTAGIVGDRFHKMYYDHDGVRGSGHPGSSEHYMNNLRLRPHVPAVEALFRRGTPISNEELEKAGS